MRRTISGRVKKLRHHRQVAVVAPARRRHQSPRNLPLHDHKDFFRQVADCKQPVQDRRGDVVRQAAVNAPGPREKLLQPQGQNIAVNDPDRQRSYGRFQLLDQRRVELDGNDLCTVTG